MCGSYVMSDITVRDPDAETLIKSIQNSSHYLAVFKYNVK